MFSNSPILYFQGASWQRYQTYFMRNILDATPKTLQGEIKAKVQTLLQLPYTDTPEEDS